MDKDNNLFSNTKPNLVSEKIIKKFDKILEKKSPSGSSNTISYIYEHYIQPNWFAIIVVIILGLFLIVRHFIKKYKEENNEPLETEGEIESDESIEDIDEIKEDTLSEETSEVAYEQDNINQNPNNPTNFDTIQNQYEQMIKENNGLMSEQHIKDLYSKKNDKMVFNEMSRMIVDGGAN